MGEILEMPGTINRSAAEEAVHIELIKRAGETAVSIRIGGTDGAAVLNGIAVIVKKFSDDMKLPVGSVLATLGVALIGRAQAVPPETEQ